MQKNVVLLASALITLVHTPLCGQTTRENLDGVPDFSGGWMRTAEMEKPSEIVGVIPVKPNTFHLSSDEKSFFGVNAGGFFTVGALAELNRAQFVGPISIVSRLGASKSGYKRLLVTDASKTEKHLKPARILPFPDFQNAIAIDSTSVYFIQGSTEGDSQPLAGELSCIRIQSADFIPTSSFTASFSPDSRHCAFQYSNDSPIYVLELSTPNEIQQIGNCNFPACFSADSKRFIACRNRNLLTFKVKASGFELLETTKLPSRPIHLGDGLAICLDESQQSIDHTQHVVAMQLDEKSSVTSVSSSVVERIDTGSMGEGLSVSGSAKDFAFVQSQQILGSGAWSTVYRARLSDPVVNAALKTEDIRQLLPSKIFNGGVDLLGKSDSPSRPMEFEVSKVTLRGVSTRLIQLSESGNTAFLEGPSETWVIKLPKPKRIDVAKSGRSEKKTNPKPIEREAIEPKLKLSSDWEQAKGWNLVKWVSKGDDLVCISDLEGQFRSTNYVARVFTKEMHGDVEVSYTAHTKEMQGRIKLRFDPDNPGTGVAGDGYGPGIDIDIGDKSGNRWEPAYKTGRVQCLQYSKTPSRELKRQIDEAAGDNKIYRYKIQLVGNHLLLMINDQMVVNEVIPGFRDKGIIRIETVCRIYKDSEFLLEEFKIKKL